MALQIKKSQNVTYNETSPAALMEAKLLLKSNGYLPELGLKDQPQPGW